MSMHDRTSIISPIEKALYTKLIAYLTGDRQGMPTQIGSDAVPLFRRHLESIGEVESISLFLYSRGGDTNVPWRLVSLIREYCEQFNVIVPFRAHSAATLLSLGADNIYMSKMAELSSIDPSVANTFNPPDPANPAARVAISVEDVNAYKDLARRFGIGEDKAELNAQVFLALASKIDPLALGNVERSYNQIRKLAEDLLHMHMESDDKNQKCIVSIVDTLTQRLYSHQHLINRKEAKRIGLKVEAVDKPLEEIMWKLFADYSTEMLLDQAFNAPRLLGSQSTARIDLRRAFVESSSLTDAFITTGQIVKLSTGGIQLPAGVSLPQGIQPQIPVAVQIESEEWQQLR